MSKITFPNGRICAAVTALALGFAGYAHADCAISPNPFTQSPRVALTTMPEGMTLAGSEASRPTPDPDAPLSSVSADASIVGLWHSFAMSGGQVVDEAFEQWNADGTEVLNDNPPPQTGNICLGVFVKSAPYTYKLKHPSWTYDQNGNVNGIAIIRELVFLSADGNSYKGTFSVDVYDLSGKRLTQYGGTVSASRITVDF